MRSLPSVETLCEAVIYVIQSNKNDGYLPNRFIQITQDGYAPDIFDICDRLITKGETLQWLESALTRFPTLLTLEDFVAVHGLDWGFSQYTVEVAKARVKYFDQISGGKRYDER
jgi:hypothetical protein